MAAGGVRDAESGRLILGGKAKLQRAFLPLKTTGPWSGCTVRLAPQGEERRGIDPRPDWPGKPLERATGDPDGLPHISAAPQGDDQLWVPTAQTVRACQDHPTLVRAISLEVRKKSIQKTWRRSTKGSVRKAFRVSTMPGAGS